MALASSRFLKDWSPFNDPPGPAPLLPTYSAPQLSLAQLLWLHQACQGALRPAMHRPTPGPLHSLVQPLEPSSPGFMSSHLLWLLPKSPA